jgi:glutamate/tyrosine decarboxylase-like PLP-dependent enzyme
MFIKTFGLDTISAAVSRSIALAERVEQHIHGDGRWEIVTPAQLGVLTFRSTHNAEQGKEAVRAAVAKMAADGFALITTTEVRGEVMLRLCLIHPDAQFDDVVVSLELMAKFLEQAVA